MVTIGIILLVIGALVAWLAPAEVSRLGYIAAVIGLVLIVLGVLLGLADSADDDGLNDFVFLAPGLWGLRLRK